MIAIIDSYKIEICPKTNFLQTTWSDLKTLYLKSSQHGHSKVVTTWVSHDVPISHDFLTT